MKTLVQTYTYSKSAKTITLGGFTAARPVLLERILMIVDATINQIVYNVADSTVATATVTSNNVITLSAVPSASADADKLTIIYDTLPGDPQTANLSPYATAATVLSTELNALANNGNTVLSAAYDNATNRYPQADIRLTVATQGSARSAGAMIAVYMSTRLDGSAFDDGNATTAELVAVFPLDAATTARVATRRRIALPPEQVEFFAVNSTGQALASSSNIVTIRPYYDVSP